MDMKYFDFQDRKVVLISKLLLQMFLIAGIQTLILRQFQIQMIGRNRPQLAMNQYPRALQQPSKRHPDPSYPLHQKQNLLPLNPSFANSARPLISPKKQQLSERLPLDPHRRSQPIKSHRSPPPPPSDPLPCSNHPNKRAEFRVGTQEGEEHYCGRCAAQLATQGCEVERIQNSAGLRVSKRSELPQLPQYENQPIYQEIMQILRLCNSVVEEHSSNIEQFAGLEGEYGQQVQLTAAFYDRLVEIIEEMKEDHLADLMQERDKYTQIADIENDNLRENIIQVNVIKNDIQNHIEEVLQGIQVSGDSAECRQSLDHYRQKLAFFRHRTEEQLDSLAQVTRYSQPKIHQMIAAFENFLKVMWDEDSPGTEQPQHAQRQGKQLNSAMTVKNIHQILPRGVAYEGDGKRAFRNLEAEQEEEEQESVQERKSPNFKRI